MLLALSGGVGGARLAYGLSKIIPTDQLQIAVNIGDDFVHLGLSVCPDLDTVCYALSELDDVERGWGRANETWNFMEALRSVGGPAWFQLGDADLALHVLRTDRLMRGDLLEEITTDFARKLGIGCAVFPISNDKVATSIETNEGVLSFQDYFVQKQCRPRATGFNYQGAESACPSEQFSKATMHPELEAIIICPSNPWLSIGPMLAVPSVEIALRASPAPIIAVSPIVGGKAVKGPAAKLMGELGLEISALSIAQHYRSLIDGIVIDSLDAPLREEIEKLGLRVLVTDTLMSDRNKRIALAETIVDWIHE